MSSEERKGVVPALPACAHVTMYQVFSCLLPQLPGPRHLQALVRSPGARSELVQARRLVP